MHHFTHDYLIVGQGLAGSLLARLLIRAGQRVLVLDDGLKTSSSKVAAGMINPLAGMRFNAAPETADWLASALRQYAEMADSSGQQRFHALGMQRLLRSPEQKRFYDRQKNNPAVAGFLGAALTPEDFDTGVNAPFGGFAQRQTGYLDMPGLLEDIKQWLIAQQAYKQQPIDYAAVNVDAHGVCIGGDSAPRLIFCEGYQVRNNPWFKPLPLQADKGEFLHLRCARKLVDHIINGAHWILPTIDGDYRLGATHEHHDINTHSTPQARVALIKGLQHLLGKSDDIQVYAQGAGVRPATSDRKPFLGQHPQQAALYVFNGFGARGALTIPWHAEQMCEYLLHQRPLPDSANIQRLGDWA